MYPKKRGEIVGYRMREYTRGRWNACCKCFTQEIKERANVERLARILFLQENPGKEKYWENKTESMEAQKSRKIIKKKYYKRAKAISAHITEGLEE